MDDLKMYARMGLQAELDRLDARRVELAALLQQLDETVSRAQPRKRQMSDEGRERIREAVQRRWARVRAAQAEAADVKPETGTVATRKRRSAGSSPAGRVSRQRDVKSSARVNRQAGSRKK
jgi:hypothetical protein